jgi:hypothetical protein
MTVRIQLNPHSTLFINFLGNASLGVWLIGRSPVDSIESMEPAAKTLVAITATAIDIFVRLFGG